MADQAAPRTAVQSVLAGPRWPSALLAAVVTLAGCGTADPPEFVKARDSNYGEIGDVRLLHVHVATPPREGLALNSLDWHRRLMTYRFRMRLKLARVKLQSDSAIIKLADEPFAVVLASRDRELRSKKLMI
jgi:hypothetical protein